MEKRTNRKSKEQSFINDKVINKMNNKMNFKFITVLAFATLAITSCKKDDDSSLSQQSTSINKILALGASRVEGSRPEFESYRYELWKSLKENNWIIDFIGTQTDESSYTTFNNMNFDVDHEGRGGWTSGEILNGLGDWLNQTGSADIVLLSSPGVMTHLKVYHIHKQWLISTT